MLGCRIIKRILKFSSNFNSSLCKIIYSPRVIMVQYNFSYNINVLKTQNEYYISISCLNVYCIVVKSIILKNVINFSCTLL